MFKRIKEHYKDYGKTWNYSFDPRYFSKEDRSFLRDILLIILISVIIYKVDSLPISIIIAFAIVGLKQK